MNMDYHDIFYTQQMQNGNVNKIGIGLDEDGVQVAHSDLSFRENVMPMLMNEFNGRSLGFIRSMG